MNIKILSIILTITLIFFSQESLAIKKNDIGSSKVCDLKDIGMGKNFSELKDKYKLDEGEAGDSKFTSSIRGSTVCKELGNNSVVITFIDNIAAEMVIQSTSTSPILYNSALESFGKPKRMPNFDKADLKTYTTFWGFKKNAVSYKFTRSDDNKTFKERIIFQRRDFDDEFKELNKSD